MIIGNCEIYIGTSGWTYDHWKGTFYPLSLPKSRWFDFYSQHFPAVEVNATFYRTFAPATYEKWHRQAPHGFLYVLKVPRIITHRKFLKDVRDDINAFEHSAMLLKEKLGALLLQIAPQTPCDTALLEEVCSMFMHPEKVTVEFRHPCWFTSSVDSLLKKYHMIACNFDSPSLQRFDWITADTAYFRLHGHPRWYASNYSLPELQALAGQIKEATDQGLKRVFVFFNNDFHGYAPDNARQLTGLLTNFVK